MSQSSSIRISGDRIPKISSNAVSEKYDVWKRRMEALLLAYGLRLVVIHPIAKGSLAERAASKGPPILMVKDVEEKSVSTYLEVEGETEEVVNAVASSSSVSSAGPGKDETKDVVSESVSSTSSTTPGAVSSTDKAKIIRKLVSKSLEAYNLLLSALDENLIRLFSDVSVGDALWTVMERHFLQANTSAGEIASLTEELATIKMVAKKNGNLETVPEFVARIKSIVSRLTALNSPANEMNVMIRFIKAVEESGLSEYHIDCQLAWRDLRSGRAKSLDDLVVEFVRERTKVNVNNGTGAASMSGINADSGNYAGEWQQQKSRGHGGRGRGRGNGRGLRHFALGS